MFLPRWPYFKIVETENNQMDLRFIVKTYGILSDKMNTNERER